MIEDDNAGVPQGDPDQDADPGDPADQPPMIDPDLPLEAKNLVPELAKDPKTAEWLQSEAAKVIKRCDLHMDQRSEFMQRRADQLKQYTGLTKKLKFPAEGDRAPHHPLVLQAMLSLWSRLWDQVCPAKGDIVHIAVVGEPDEERQMLVEKHMNWQLRTKMPDWVSSQGDSIMQWLLSGSNFREYVWDPIAKCNRVDHVPIEDMVISYAEKDTHPLMPTVPCVTRVLRVPKHLLLEYQKIGWYDGIDELYEEGGGAFVGAGVNYVDGGPVRDAAMKIDGVEKPEGQESQDPDPVRELLRQHIWLELPSVGYKPVTFVVDRKSKKPVYLSVRETPDSLDQSRFDREQAAAVAKAKSIDGMLQQQQAAAGPPMPGAPPPVPPEPTQPDKVRPVKMVPLYTVIHYRLFPNPEGFYGIGAGYLLENSNALVDELLADVLISGRLANIPQGFISNQMSGLKGDIQAVPGKFHAVDIPGEQLKDAIHQFQFNPPPPVLMDMIKFLVNESKDQTANQEILSGEKGSSHETAAQYKGRNNNAMTVVNVMTRLYIEPLKYEMKLIAHGNSIFMPAEEWFSVVAPSQATPGANDVQSLKIARDAYLEDYHITFTADSRMTSKSERIQDAFNLSSQIAQSPVSKGPSGPALTWLAQKEIFHALDKPEFEAALGKPPAPPPPPSPESQVEENAGFLNEKDHPVLPDDNHVEHLAYITEFRDTPYFEKMSSTGKQLLDRHERAHLAAHYQQAATGAQNGQGAGMGAGPGQPGGVPAGRPGAAPQGMAGPPGGAAAPPGGGGGPVPGAAPRPS